MTSHPDQQRGAIEGMATGDAITAAVLARAIVLGPAMLTHLIWAATMPLS